MGRRILNIKKVSCVSAEGFTKSINSINTSVFANRRMTLKAYKLNLDPDFAKDYKKLIFRIIFKKARFDNLHWFPA